jgi:hypothetical protein
MISLHGDECAFFKVASIFSRFAWLEDFCVARFEKPPAGAVREK